MSLRRITAALALCAGGIAAPATRAGRPPVHPVVDARTGYLLGGSRGGQWVRAAAATADVRDPERYVLYGLDRRTGKTAGGKPETHGPPCPDTKFVELKPAPGPGSEIAVAGTWNALPRRPRPAGAAGPAYRRVVADLLAEQGIAVAAARVDQALRIDLDGDGEEEVVVAANRQAGRTGFVAPTPDSSAGDYSVVLVRKVFGNRVRSILLRREAYPARREFNAPNVHRIKAIADLNGDGNMEIVVEGRYYEGDSSTVYEIRGARAIAVLSEGCGA